MHIVLGLKVSEFSCRIAFKITKTKNYKKKKTTPIITTNNTSSSATRSLRAAVALRDQECPSGGTPASRQINRCKEKLSIILSYPVNSASFLSSPAVPALPQAKKRGRPQAPAEKH